MHFPRNGRRRGGRRLTALAARWQIAAAVLVVALVALFAMPAQAQNATVTLVRNINQADAGYSGYLEDYTHAQTFTTGDNAGGYTLSSIQVDFASGFSVPTRLAFSLWSVDSGGEPSAKLVDLTNPASLIVGVNKFTAPSGTKLLKETSYAVHMSGDAGSPKYTTSNDEGGAKSGWSIRDNSWDKLGSGWNSEQYALQIRVKGTIDADDSVASLSALSLTDASSNSIDLSPGFTEDNLGYTASVANSVDVVTLAATATSDGATVAITGDTDITTPGEATLDLAEGANTLTVTVTAADTTTMVTYTVAVFRAVSAPTPAPTPSGPRT